MTLAVVIPVNALDLGKSRLSGQFDATLRRRLCESMLRWTLAVTPADALPIIVSDDGQVGALARGVRPDVLFLPAAIPRNLNAALAQGRDAVPPGWAMLVLPTDLALLDSAALDAFLNPSDDLAIAPDIADQGTNLLRLPATAVAAFRFAYGAGSLERHIGEATRLGFLPRFHREPRTAVDIDLPQDIAAARQNSADEERLAALPPFHRMRTA